MVSDDVSGTNNSGGDSSSAAELLHRPALAAVAAVAAVAPVAHRHGGVLSDSHGWVFPSVSAQLAFLDDLVAGVGIVDRRNGSVGGGSPGSSVMQKRTVAGQVVDRSRPEDLYQRTVAELQALASRAPHVTQRWVLEVASMDPAEMRRRLIRSSDWHGQFAHSLDGIPEIRNLPGAGIDGCRSHREVRAVVLGLVERVKQLTKCASSMQREGAASSAPPVEVIAGRSESASSHTELDAARDRIERMASFLEGEATCPCCQGVTSCEDDCTFEVDAPHEHSRLMAARQALTGE